MPGQFRGLYLLTTLVTDFIKKRRALINIQPQKRGSASRIHQHQPKNGGSASKDNFYGSSSIYFVELLVNKKLTK